MFGIEWKFWKLDGVPQDFLTSPWNPQNMWTLIKPKVLFMTDVVNPSALLKCIHQSATVFIYRPARSQVQGEFSQFEAVWPFAMICSCHYSPLLSAHFFKALVWPVAGGYSEEVSGRVMGNWALMRNGQWDYHAAREKAGKEGLAEPIGGWTCTYNSTDTDPGQNRWARRDSCGILFEHPLLLTTCSWQEKTSATSPGLQGKEPPCST